MLVPQELVLELLADNPVSDSLASDADTYSFALKDHTSLATASAIAQIISYAVASSFVANTAAITSIAFASTSTTLHYIADPSHQD